MSEYLRQLVDRLKSDRKLSIMIALLMVALLLWGRLLLQSDLPRTATAEPNTARAGNPPATASAASKAAGSATVTVELPTHLGRDLFNFPAEEFAWAKPKNSEPERKEEKSAPQRSEEQLRSAVVRRAAQELHLQSVVTGETPSVVINGRVLRPGQQIQGFTLLSISERHVLLEQHGVLIRLKM